MQKRILTRILRVWGGMLPPSYCKPFGRIAQKFRAALAACISPNIGKNVNIEKGGYVFPDTVIGDNSGIGVNCEICHGLTLGKNVMMGPEGYTDIRPIVIEDDVWIGRRAIIMGGVTIGKGAVIGAGSVVTKDVPPYCVAAGNPAIVRKNLLDEQELAAE